MKEIRHYTKRISDFPRSSIDLESLLPEVLWNDTLIFLTRSITIKHELDSLNWTEIKQNKNLLGLHAILCFLLIDPVWKEESINCQKLAHFLKTRLPNLSSNVKPYTEWMSDGERTEELVRALFSFLEVFPEGETEKYFADRLRSINTIERMLILEESKKAQERAKEILRKIKQAEEEEAASKYNRE